MENGNLHALAQLVLDHEAFGRFYVFEIYAAEGGLQARNNIYQLVDVGLVYFYVEDIDIGEFLEQHRLAFHYRFGGEWANITESEYSGAVGDYRNQIPARGDRSDFGGVLHD